MRITNSYRPLDAYLDIRKRKYQELTERVSVSLYLRIIKEVDKLIEKKFLSGHRITFPNNMGSIELRKNKTSVFTSNGKIRTNKSIDWVKTRKLWENDEECLKSKFLIYTENGYKPCVFYDKRNALYNNKSFFSFRVNRKIIQKAHIVIDEGDCLIFNRY